MSGLRPVLPIVAGDVVPGEPGARPDLCWVPVSRLVIDRTYQRDLSEKSLRLIRRIVAGWDWGRVKALNAYSRDDGTFELIDGQHTAIAAATHGGIAELPCLVRPHRGMAAAAADFVGINSARLAVTPAQQFWASIAAGDRVAARIVEAAERAGVRLLRTQPSRWRPGDTVAYAALRKLAERLDDADLSRVLGGARNAGLAPVRALHLKALARLIASPEYRGTVNGARLVAALREDATDIERAARDARADLGGALDAHFATELFRRAA